MGPAVTEDVITTIRVSYSPAPGIFPGAADTPATGTSMDTTKDTFEGAFIEGYPLVVFLFNSDTEGGTKVPVMGVLVGSAYSNSDKCMGVGAARGELDGGRGVFLAEGELTSH